MGPTVTDYFSLSIARLENGNSVLLMSCKADMSDEGCHIRRHYRAGTEVGDVVDDAARVLSGWGALGLWGMVDTADALVQLH